MINIHYVLGLPEERSSLEKLLAWILRGGRMKVTELAFHDKSHQKILECWSHKQSDRPSAVQISKVLSEARKYIT